MWSANTAKVKKAFGKLEFVADTGLFLEESAYSAKVILPVCGGLEVDFNSHVYFVRAAAPTSNAGS